MPRLPGGDQWKDYAALQRHHGERILNVQEYRGQVEMRGRDRVGVVRLPSGRRILIRTKVPGLVLLDWLVYLGKFPDIQFWDQDGNVTQSESYQSVLASLFFARTRHRHAVPHANGIRSVRYGITSNSWPHPQPSFGSASMAAASNSANGPLAKHQYATESDARRCVGTYLDVRQ